MRLSSTGFEQGSILHGCDLYVGNLPFSSAANIHVDITIVRLEDDTIVGAAHASAPADECHVAIDAHIEAFDLVRLDDEFG